MFYTYVLESLGHPGQRYVGHTTDLRLGTSSWKYDSWNGLLYDPARTYSADDYRADYAKHLNTPAPASVQ